MNGKAMTSGNRVSPLSIENISEETKVISFPELVYMSDFMLSLPILSYIALIIDFLIIIVNL